MGWIILLCLLCPVARSAAAELDWPLKILPRSITGTFMEPRSAHFHSGLDLRTEGRVGVPVYAPADGTLARVRCSPEGYGKAVYLSLEDGRTLVFAHLSAFVDPIQEIVTRAQSASRRYEQDLSPSAAGAPRFRRGELLALSGATGTGAPHLHLELRGADGRPQNPLLFGFEPSDRRAPDISELRLLPLDAASRVEGRARAAAVEPGGQIRAVGRLGVQLRARDTTEHASFPLMPARIELWLDDRLQFSMAQEEFDFAESGQMRLEIDRDDGSRWIRLYRRAGNSLGKREGPSGLSFEIADDGSEHRLEVVVGDAAGNLTRASVRLLAAREAAASPGDRLEFDPLGPGLEVHFGEAVCEIRTVDDLPTAAKEVAAGVHALETGAAVAWLRTRGWDAAIAGGEAAKRRRFGEAGLWIEDPTGQGLYPGGVLRLGATEAIAPGGFPEGCKPLGPAVELRSHGTAFAAGLAVGWAFEGPLAAGGALFQRAAGDDWKYIGVREGPECRDLRAVIDRSGWIAPFRDNLPPRLGPWRLENGGGVDEIRRRDEVERLAQDGLRLPAWPSVILEIHEAGAGVAVEDVLTRLDGAPFPARYNPEEGLLAFDFHVEPAAGEHVAEVEVRDRVGNVARQQLRFSLHP